MLVMLRRAGLRGLRIPILGVCVSVSFLVAHAMSSPRDVRAQRAAHSTEPPNVHPDVGQGAPAAQTLGSGQVTIAAAGDILLHIKVNEAAARHGFDRLFEGLAPHLPPDHIAFANLETPLVDDVSDVETGSPPILGSRVEAAAALARAGFDVLGCANNHAFDQRSEGAIRTVDAVRAAGMMAIGVAPESPSLWQPQVRQMNGIRVAFLSVTEGLNRGPGRPVQAHVASLAEPDLIQALSTAHSVADVVVLAVHWSYDYAPGPSWRQRRLARRWVAAGADLVLGTGPHVLHPVERLTSPRGDALVAYSLGNLISNQGHHWAPGRRISPRAHTALRLPETRDGVLLRTTATVENGHIRWVQVEGLPLFTLNNFWRWRADNDIGHDIRVVPLRATEVPVWTSRWRPIQEALGSAVHLLDAPSPGAAPQPTPTR